MEVDLYNETRRCNLVKVIEIINNNPKININAKQSGWTAFHVACFNGDIEIVKVFLVHNNIDVNKQSNSMRTGFYLACYWGRTDIVKLLIRDKRVIVNLEDDVGGTPLWWASRRGYHEIVKLILAFGQEDVDLKLNVKSKSDNDDMAFTVLEIAERHNQVTIVEIIKQFNNDPLSTKHQLQIEFKVVKILVSELFVSVVMFCDGYFVIRQCEKNDVKTIRFFKMLEKLPMELQMILCGMVYDYNKDIVRIKDIESSLKNIIIKCPFNFVPYTFRDKNVVTKYSFLKQFTNLLIY
jgi:hypothetical protein